MSSADHSPPRRPQTDIFFIPAPDRVVTEMLKIAQINGADLVMDLGSGNGGILIAAARTHGSHGLGIEIDPELVAESRAKAAEAGVADRLEFFEQDFFEADLRPATALMLYLLDTINIRLRPKILAECLPGTRVVTYSFEMGDWECDAHIPIAANGVSLWIVPANLTGTWRIAAPAKEPALSSITLRQHFQELAGSAEVDGCTCQIAAGRVRGEEFTISVLHPTGTLIFSGQVSGDLLSISMLAPDGEQIAMQGEREPGTRVALEKVPPRRG